MKQMKLKMALSALMISASMGVSAQESAADSVMRLIRAISIATTVIVTPRLVVIRKIPVMEDLIFHMPLSI